MKTALSSALRVICALCFLLSLVEGSNNTTTSEDGTTKYTGWHKGPAERGTMTILWSCLTTVFACTWTILHLNVPNLHRDSTWDKILRKIKWMAITVIFPEFIFAKAVCELQMAIEDMHELKKQEDAFEWDVEYGWGCRLLHWLFRDRTTSSSLPLPAVAASGIEEVNIEVKRFRKWTLTHTYFANMGGIVVKRLEGKRVYLTGYAPSPDHTPVTAHALAKCYVPNKHSLPDDFRLTQGEIMDKSKADNLLKTIAALQILWLIVSVITRKVYRLPISLLEVCTVAFAALAVATYVANLAKPKDVDVPVILNNKKWNHNDDDGFSGLWGDSFFARAVNPTEQHGPSVWKPRIKNDMLRLQAHGTQHLTLMYALALSTVCFGAIHCAAWQNYFPSQIERRLWQVASVVSSALPLTNLLALFTSNILMGRKAHKIITTIESLMNPPLEDPSGSTREPDRSTGLTHVKLSWIEGKLQGKGLRNTNCTFELQLSLTALLKVRNGVEQGEASRAWCTEFLRPCKKLGIRGSEIAFAWVDNPKDAWKFDEVLPYVETFGRSHLTGETMSPLLEIINNSRETTKKLCDQWYGLTTILDRLSTIIAWLSGLLYITARLILLAVAFAAFRKQNEDLYIDTWTRFMPSWR